MTREFHALLQRIKDALPMDAASPKAQAFHDEWQALIQPFIDAASPAAREGLRNFYAHVEDWYQEIGPGFIIEAFRFHRETERARAAMKMMWKRGAGVASASAPAPRPE